MLVRMSACLMFLGGALMISGHKAGGYLIALTTIMQSLTIDNPLLQNSSVSKDLATSNFLKNLTTITANLLIALKLPREVKHRR